MDKATHKALVNVNRYLVTGMTLLVMAEVAFLLQGFFNYIAGVIGACVVLIARFVLYKYKEEKGWKQRLMMVLPALAIVGPFFYLLYKIIFTGSTYLWIELVLMLSFLLPVLLMFHCYRTIKGLTKDNVI